MTPSDAIRGDALLFYSMAISSFIESTTPEYVVQLRQLFRGDAQFTRWLEDTWQREELGHGRLMREQIARFWPAFDLDAAYVDFTARYVPRCHISLLRPTPALEALARCVTEAQAAGSYRALAWHCRDKAEDLQSMFVGMAADEARHYSYFRRTFERYNAVEKHRRLCRTRVIFARMLLVRDEDLPLGFAVLNEHWRSPPPFQLQDYRGYLRSLGALLRDGFPMDATIRMLLKPIGATPGTQRWVAAAVPRVLRHRFLRERSRAAVSVPVHGVDTPSRPTATPRTPHRPARPSLAGWFNLAGRRPRPPPGNVRGGW